MIRLTQFAVKEKSVIILLAVGVLIAGLFSWNSLRQELLPDIEFPFVTIITPMPGAGAEDVAVQVTEPVEQAISNIPRLQTVQSTSGSSLSLVFAEFDFGTDLKETLTEVEQAVGQLDLPQGSEPQVSSFDFNSQPIVVATIGPSRGRRPHRSRRDRPQRGRAGPAGHRRRLHGRPDRRPHAHPRHRARPRGHG